MLRDRFFRRGTSNQTCAVVVSDVGPRPLHHYHEPVAKADQKQEVNEQPGQPGEESRDVQLSQVAYSLRPANGRQSAFIDISECFTSLALQ